MARTLAITPSGSGYVSGVEIALVAAAVVGTGVAVAGQVQQAQAQRRAARQNAAALEEQALAAERAAQIEAEQERQNAALAEAEAQREAEYQEFRERRARERQRFLTGDIRARTAAAGLLMEGSPLFVLEENLRQTELGLLAERAESESRQAALRTEAGRRQFAGDVLRFQGQERLRIGRLQAGIMRSQGEQAFTSGLIRAGGRLITGGTGAFRQFQAARGLTAAQSNPLF